MARMMSAVLISMMVALAGGLAWEPQIGADGTADGLGAETIVASGVHAGAIAAVSRPMPISVIVMYSGDPSGRDAFIEAARHAGIRVSDKVIYQLTYGKTLPEQWGFWDQWRIATNVTRAHEAGADLVYVDYEPPQYSTDPSAAMVGHFRSLISQTRALDPSGSLSVGVYGFPYNRYWAPFTTTDAVWAAARIDAGRTLDWFGPSLYLAHQSGDRDPDDPTDDDTDRVRVANRIAHTITISRMLAGDRPVIPFVQLTLRGPHNYEPLTRQTTSDLWSSLMASGVSEVVLWVDNGARGERAAMNLDLITEQGPWIVAATRAYVPGED